MQRPAPQSSAPSFRTAPARARHAFTLLELIIALLIFTIISTAVCVLTVGAMNTDRFLRSANTAQAEAEIAMRRIVHNLQTAQTGSIAIGTGTTIQLITQPDSTSGYPSGATITYSVNASKQLIENDPRLNGNNVLANNVSTFTIAYVTGFADLYQVDLVINSQPITERHFKVYNRN